MLLIVGFKPGHISLYFPEKAWIAHVGFIDQWDERGWLQVEGNRLFA